MVLCGLPLVYSCGILIVSLCYANKASVERHELSDLFFKWKSPQKFENVSLFNKKAITLKKNPFGVCVSNSYRLFILDLPFHDQRRSM